MNRQKQFFLCCGILMLASELWKQWCLTFLLGGGHYNWWYFPFQLCSIPMYVCLLIGLIPSRKWNAVFLTFLMDYGLLAGIFTFFDTSGLHYEYLPLTIHSYIWHIVLIVLGLSAGHTLMHRLSRSHTYDTHEIFLLYKKSTCIYLACAFIATLCNFIFHPYGNINMFYISPYYPMSQKTFGKIAVLLGNNAGILLYITAVMLGAWLIHCLWYYLPFERKPTGSSP